MKRKKDVIIDRHPTNKIASQVNLDFRGLNVPVHQSIQHVSKWHVLVKGVCSITQQKASNAVHSTPSTLRGNHTCGISVLWLHELISRRSQIWHAIHLKNVVGVTEILFVFCYLQMNVICRVEETESGSRLPLNKQGKKGRMSASGNHKTGQGRLVSSILFLNSLIHAATPPPFWFIQGNSISILDPSLALPINSSLPSVGP